MKTRTLFLVLAIAGLLGATGYGLYGAGMSQGMKMAGTPAVTTERGAVDAASGRKALYWHDPMYPQQKFDKPGKSPFMDMELVPVYADGEADGNTVRINPRIRQSLGMRTAQATAGPHVEAVGSVEPAAKKQSVLVPSEALIRTGTRDVVIVDEGAGYFRPQEVQVGRESGEQTEILAGVSAGERVVTSGQFLIDSEASMKGVMSRLNAGDKP